MDKNNDKLKRLQTLTSLLGEAAKTYYMEDREILPNIEYDKLYDELAALEAETGVTLAGSPTARVGYTVSSELVREAHSSPMLSLDKTKSPAQLAAWLDDKRGLLSWKLDGLTIALTYEGGVLAKAVTRGDGETGEVVTHNAETFINLPVSIPFKGTLNIRGEAVISYSDFEKINAELPDTDARYKNPRNLASGSVRQLNSEVTASRRLRFYAFALVGAAGDSFDFNNSRDEQMRFLAAQGFQTVEYFVVTAESVEDEVSRFAHRVADTDLPSDGLVLIYDDIAYGESLGRTTKFPRDGIAFKWEDEQAESVLLDIEWNTSRTGLINPTAVFKPVEIEGSTISRASLHNVSIMEELALGKGDKIRVYKANMIIPQIAENLTRSGTMRVPARCRVCEFPTEIMDNTGVRSLYCTNPDCVARRIKEFTHFVSQRAMNIDGLSEQTLEKFISEGFIHEFADIFRIARHRDAAVNIDGFGEKSFDNLIAAIDKARTTTAVRLLNSLGIPQIGLANAKLICRALDNDWDKIRNAPADELVEIKGVGEVMAQSYTAWFADEANSARVDALLAEIRFDEAETVPSGDALTGLTFVITGSLEHYANRDELKAVIEAQGGKATGSVSDKTDYLINNDAKSGSSKNKKAQELGVKIITEAEFRDMLGEQV
ncbi:MAG: NAD-dependent DNA ligase LigA [Clostridiales Family XIII bacterium]|jgi:DNA ligase (NAD+)|nr:NAD-dependent DNA ligase LigA [Clostridiales Family XIII bacterium]